MRVGDLNIIQGSGRAKIKNLFMSMPNAHSMLIRGRLSWWLKLSSYAVSVKAPAPAGAVRDGWVRTGRHGRVRSRVIKRRTTPWCHDGVAAAVGVVRHKEEPIGGKDWAALRQHPAASHE